MNIFSFAFIDFEGRQIALVKAPESLLVDKKKRTQRHDAISNYGKVFNGRTVVLFHEDKWGVKTFHSNDQPLANKLVSHDLSQAKWETYDMDK